MNYKRMPIEVESPEQLGYHNIRCNLTESSFADANLKDLQLELDDLLLCYGDHLGHFALRELLSAESGISADSILITAGAASALFIVSTSLLEKGDEILVIKPNYATNIETPKTIGANIQYLDLQFENNFRLDMDDFRKKISPKTKLVSLTTPHNPTGMVISEKELKEIIGLVEKNGSYLLVDETYRDMHPSETPLVASLSDRVISVSSISKTYGLPGIRIGWIFCKNRQLFETFLAAKEQIFITNSLVDEVIAFQYMKRKKYTLPKIMESIEKHKRMVDMWISKEARMEWIAPQAGVACLPRIKSNAYVNIDSFYKILNEKYKTYVGPGHWFDMDKRYMRIGYGWPTTKELQEGLENITKALNEA